MIVHRGEGGGAPARGSARLFRQLERHGALSSTNDRALALAREGAPEGTVVIAEAQTAGRGQRGARWHSPPGGGLYASFVLRPRLEPDRAAMVTLAAGLAVHEAIAAHLPGLVGLKWPNDVLVREGPAIGKKVAGILVEASLDASGLQHAVVGIGVNLKGRPDEAEPQAISLEALGALVEPEPFLEAIALHLELGLERLELGDAVAVTERWTERALGLGLEVELDTGDRRQRGRFLGIDADGSVVLEDDRGALTRYVHGRLKLPLPGGAPGVRP